MIADFSLETLVVRGERHNIFQVQKERNSQLQNPVKLSFRNAGEIKIFLDEEKLREFVAIRPIFKEWLKEALQIENNNKRRLETSSRKEQWKGQI